MGGNTIQPTVFKQVTSTYFQGLRQDSWSACTFLLNICLVLDTIASVRVKLAGAPWYEKICL